MKRLVAKLARIAFGALCAAPGLAHAQADLTEKRYALLIGIDTNGTTAGIERLNFAKADAKALEQVLDANGWEAVPLVDDQATASAVIGHLSHLASVAREQDSVLVYYSGHGIRSSIGRKRTYWLTYANAIEPLDVNGIRLNHLLDYLDDIPAKRKLLILDHCHSGDAISTLATGGARDAQPGVSVVRNAFPTAELREDLGRLNPSGLVVMGSAREQAFEFPELGHGLFTHVLLKALTSAAADTSPKNGRLSIGELVAYLKPQVAELSRDKKAPQENLDWITGSDITSWELVSLPATAQDDLEARVKLYRKVLTDLQSKGLIDWSQKSRCFQAVEAFERATKDGASAQETDQRIVNELDNIAHAPTTLDARTKADMLKTVLATLEGNP